MTFIESWFGVSPDGGDGSLELAYVLLAMAAISLWMLRGRIAGRWRARRARSQQ